MKFSECHLGQLVFLFGDLGPYVICSLNSDNETAILCSPEEWKENQGKFILEDGGWKYEVEELSITYIPFDEWTKLKK